MVNIKPHVVGTNRREHSRPLSLYDPPCMVIFDGECIDDHGTKGASISRSVRRGSRYEKRVSKIVRQIVFPIYLGTVETYFVIAIPRI